MSQKSLRAKQLEEAKLLLQLNLLRARKDLVNFIAYTKPDYEFSWHHVAVCREVQNFITDDNKILLLSLPPRHGKSEIISRKLPPFLYGLNPNLKIISASYGADLASRMNRDVQRVIDDPLYQQVFPHVKLNDRAAVSSAQFSYLRNSEIFEIVNHAGSYRSTGVGGGITGMGADFLLIDDPVKNWAEALSNTFRETVWDWFSSTAFTRLEKNGKVLIVMTRWHKDDLAGRVIKMCEEGNIKYKNIVFEATKDVAQNPHDKRAAGQALWENKYNLDQLGEIKKAVGSKVWSALYQQSPSVLDGQIFMREWMLRTYRELPEYFDTVIQSWDATFSKSTDSDFVCCQVWGRLGGKYYLLDSLRKRMSYTETKSAIKSMSAKWPRSFKKVIEKKANGAALLDDLRDDVTGMVGYTPTESKLARAHAVTPLFEAGNVLLPDPSIAPWVHDYIEELTSFPSAAHDDQVDATTQALIHLKENGAWLSGMVDN